MPSKSREFIELNGVYDYLGYSRANLRPEPVRINPDLIIGYKEVCDTIGDWIEVETGEFEEKIVRCCFFFKKIIKIPKKTFKYEEYDKIEGILFFIGDRTRFLFPGTEKEFLKIMGYRKNIVNLMEEQDSSETV